MGDGGRLGVTPVVAIVLLLGMTVTAAGGAYTWFSGTMAQAQDEADTALATSLAVKGVSCRYDRVTLTLSNTGGSTITTPTADVLLYRDGDLVAATEQDVSGAGYLDPGEVGTTTFTVPVQLTMQRSHRVELSFRQAGAVVTTNCRVDRLAPVGHWTFDTGAVNATHAVDVAGTNPGVLAPGTPQQVDGIRGGALRFDGAADNVTVPDAPPLDVTTNFTLTAWFRSDSEINASNDAVGLVSKEGAYGMWWQGGDAGKLRFGTFGGNIKSTRTTWLADTWYHVAIVHEGDTSRIYVNGTLDLEATNTDPVTDAAAPFTIGRDVFEDIWFDGLLDDVRLYNVSLSSSNVNATM